MTAHEGGSDKSGWEGSGARGGIKSKEKLRHG